MKGKKMMTRLEAVISETTWIGGSQTSQKEKDKPPILIFVQVPGV
jgi:hypothetical protein